MRRVEIGDAVLDDRLSDHFQKRSERPVILKLSDDRSQLLRTDSEWKNYNNVWTSGSFNKLWDFTFESLVDPSSLLIPILIGDVKLDGGAVFADGCK